MNFGDETFILTAHADIPGGICESGLEGICGVIRCLCRSDGDFWQARRIRNQFESGDVPADAGRLGAERAAGER